MSCGFGYVALAGLLGEQSLRAAPALNPLAPRQPHFPGKAKRVIFMFMQGGPTHLDTFDHKPELVAQGKATVEDGKNAKGKPLLAPQTKFRERGEVRGFHTERVRTAFNAGSGVLTVYDREARRALVWSPDAAEGWRRIPGSPCPALTQCG